MEGLLRDLGLAVRGLRRSPGFAAVPTLALGIGATTTVFSVVYGVLLRPLPFPSADRFVEIIQVVQDRETGERERWGLTPDQFLNLQEHSTLLHGIGLFGAHAPRTLTGIPIPARWNGAGVSAEHSDGLGAQPLLGRTFRREDSDKGADPVVILSERTWRTYSPFGFDPLSIDGREFRDADWSPVPAKVIVNQTFAQAHFPNTSPIGHRVQWREWKDLEIIGVVLDGRERRDGEIRRALYLPIAADGFFSNLAWLLRSSRETADVLTAARGVLAHVDPGVAAYDAASLEEILEHSAASPRLYPGDLTTFAVAASLLLMTAVAACLAPSICATRVDPVVALRTE
jgi:hypothetical protein